MFLSKRSAPLRRSRSFPTSARWGSPQSIDELGEAVQQVGAVFSEVAATTPSSTPASRRRATSGHRSRWRPRAHRAQRLRRAHEDDSWLSLPTMARPTRRRQRGLGTNSLSEPFIDMMCGRSSRGCGIQPLGPAWTDPVAARELLDAVRAGRGSGEVIAHLLVNEPPRRHAEECPESHGRFAGCIPLRGCGRC